MSDVEYPCPECGRTLIESFGTNPSTLEDDRSFQCHGYDCLSGFEADEIIPPTPTKEQHNG